MRFRSSVLESVGTRSMVATAVTVFVLLWVLLFAGPVFAETPLVRALHQASTTHSILYKGHPLKENLSKYQHLPSIL